MRNGTHYGAGILCAAALADAGMVSYLYATANAMAVPFGGAQRYFGTNPTPSGAPAGRFGALILDMATTEVAYGNAAAPTKAGRFSPAGASLRTAAIPLTRMRFSRAALCAISAARKDTASHL